MTVGTKPRIVIGATALVGLAALGGVGAVFGNEARQVAGPEPGRINVTEAATTTSEPGYALTKLMGLLPNGYDSSNCEQTATKPQDSLATVDCVQNSLPDGPTGARFSLYPDEATLDAHFKKGATEGLITQCPAGRASPGTWHYNSTPDQVEGHLVCGLYRGTPDVIWSQYSQLMLGNMQGTDQESLYAFWANNHNPTAVTPPSR